VVLLLRKNDEESGGRVLFQICLRCGAENKAGEVICKKCGGPLGTPQFSRRKKILEILAAFAIFIVLLLIVLLVLFYWISR